MNRRRLKNLFLAFVGVGVLLQTGSHLRHIVQSLRNDSTAPAPTAAATRPATSPRPRAAALKWTGTLTGRAVLEDGQPAANARVFLEGPSAQSTECDETGAFSFGQLRPGDYQLFAVLEPLASERLGPLPLGAGEDLRDLTLEVREGALLEGMVVRATDRGPVSGATIRAAGLRTTSDDTGHFSLVGLPRGRLIALVEAEGFVPRQIALSPPAQRLTLALERGAKVFGTVRAKGMPAI
ncbi:MAG: carboxypeptidase regulatory-like domain-containing protein, partial [Myxococcaceae bacterium]|nr:carboxypeptidase regulatory-like domain-containing protein [Myxococcaceae bacterium]